MSYPQRLHTFTPRSFVLPDLIGLSEPILRLHEYTSGDATFVPGDTLNPSYAAAASASREWTLSHDTSTITVARPGAPGGSRRVLADANGLNNERKERIFKLGDFERLVARAFPQVSESKLRVLCDFANLLWVLDEVTDGISSAADVSAVARGVVSVMRTRGNVGLIGSTSQGVLERMTHEFRKRLDAEGIGRHTLARFLTHFEAYMDGVVHEAAHRKNRNILSVAAYTTLRRTTSGCCPFFALVAFALDVDIPESTFNSTPALEEVWLAAVDMAWWANDLYSYAAEARAGLADHNGLTVLMHSSPGSHTLSLQAAATAAGTRYSALVKRYVRARRTLLNPKTGASDAVRAFAAALDHWPLANVFWSFETARYFGPHEAERERVRQTRVARLIPDSRKRDVPPVQEGVAGSSHPAP